MTTPRIFIPGYGHGCTPRQQARWEARYVENVTATFRRGLACLRAGEGQAGLFWLGRAERLAGRDDNISFAQAMALLERGAIKQALPRLEALWSSHDTREVGLALAGGLLRCGNPLAGRGVMGEVLARNSIAPAHYGLADELSFPMGYPGWAALSNKGELRVRVAGQAELVLDGYRIGTVPAGVHELASLLPVAGPCWWEGESLAITCLGQPVLGSPIDIQAVIRCQSLVCVEEDGISGWLWYPGEPDFLPSLYVGGQTTPLVVDGPATGFSSTALLQRPYGFHLPYRDWPQFRQASTGFYDQYGRLLRGAPVHPALIALICSPLPATSRLKGWTRQGCRKPCKTVPPHLREQPGCLVQAETPGQARAKRPIKGQIDINTMPERGHSEGLAVSGCAIIMPVWRDEAMLRASLASVLSTMPSDCRLIIVDDATPEAGLRDYLAGLARPHGEQVRLVRHEENAGFVASINTGLGLVPAGWDVILLNSDTLVFGNWVERLCGWLRREGVGTVTPFSNAGGLTSYPHAERDNPAPAAEDAAWLDRLCQGLPAAPAVSLPTANGFCMGISAACLAMVGPLRRAFFAQGYGEENDFCLRASEAGFLHLAATDVYVLHYGHSSFREGTAPLMERNLKILNRLYPGYDGAIQRWKRARPLRHVRRQLDWRRLAQLRRGCRGAVLLLQHLGGGGVARAVREQAEQLKGEGIMPLIMQPAETGCQLVSPVMDMVVPNMVFDLPDEYSLLLSFLREMGVGHVVWHHLMGHEAGMRKLHQHLGVSYDIHVHDHIWFCPRISLLGPEGRYCGEPDMQGCLRCLACGDVPVDEGMALPDYLARSRYELLQARHIVIPGMDAAIRMERHLPDCGPLTLEPLEDDWQICSAPPPRPGSLPPAPGLPVRVLVLGGIGHWKGYDLLRALGRHIQQEELPLHLVLIGSSHDDDVLLAAGIEVWGPYEDDALPGLMERAEADIGFVPSIAPETWCYTLGWLWKAGLAVYGFDIGVSAERIRQAGPAWGRTLPLGLPVAQLAACFIAAGRRDRSV